MASVPQTAHHRVAHSEAGRCTRSARQQADRMGISIIPSVVGRRSSASRARVEPGRAFRRGCGNKAAVGAEPGHGVVDRHRRDERERRAGDVLERRVIGQYDLVPAAQLRPGVLGRPDGLRPAERVEFGHPVHPAVPACPDHSQPAAVAQHPGDLGDGLGGVEPVPRRRDEHAVHARVRNTDGLAPARDGADAKRPGCQHRAHPVVGLHGDDLADPAFQRPGEKARAGRDIDRDLAVPGTSQSSALSGGPGRTRS